MGKIFCLMGKSSSGKDTIFKYLKKEFVSTLTPVVTYTTRPMRIGEADGREYYFITEEKLKEYEKGNKVIEQRLYHTVNGPWYYATIDDGSIDLKNKNYVMIVTLEAYHSLINYFGSDKVYPVYIDVEDGVRLERALKREREQKVPDYNEMCRRFLADNKDFSDENLKRACISRYYINDDMQKCITQIAKDISRQLD